MSGCPPLHRWLTACLRPIDPEERTALTAHQRACPRCREAFSLYRSLGRSERDESIPSAHPDACATGEQLAELAEADGPTPEPDVLAHVAGCPGCLTRLDRRLAAVRRARIAALQPDGGAPKSKWWKRFGR